MSAPTGPAPPAGAKLRPPAAPSREQRIVLLRDQCEILLEELPGALEELRSVQNDWEALDPDGTRAFFLRQLDRHTDSALYHYLYGRLVKSRIEAIAHARRSIELAPDWVYGYRLLMNIYGLCLFRHECTAEVQQRLEHELPSDASIFERIAATTPDQGALLGYVFDYYLYTQQPKQARAIIKLAKRFKQDWALENDAPMLVRANEGKHRALRRYARELIHWRIAQGHLDPRQRDVAEMELLVFYYRRGFAFEHALAVLDEWAGTLPTRHRAEVYFDRARFLSLLNRVDEAFRSLRRAIELGFDNLDRAELHPCLLRLRGDDRWPDIRRALRENWIDGYEARQAEALAARLHIPAPEIELPDDEGRTVRLADQRGRIVILEFWATHCQPCRTGIPELSDFTRHDAGPDVRVFMVNVANENRQLARRFIDVRRYKAHVLFSDERIKPLFGVDMIPATVVIDRDGFIRFHEQGVKPGIRERLNWWIEYLDREARGDPAPLGPED